MDGSASNSPQQTCVCGKRLVGVHVIGPMEDDLGIRPNGFTWAFSAMHADRTALETQCKEHIEQLSPEDASALLDAPDARRVSKPGAPF